MTTTFKTFVNGGTLLPSDLNAIQEDLARNFESYKKNTDQTAQLSAVSAATYLLGAGNVNTGILASNAAAALGVFRFEPSWEHEETPTARTPKCNLRFSVLANATAPTISFTAGLYKVETSAGGSATNSITLATSAISGSTAVVTTPAAESKSESTSTDFAFPEVGFYALAVVLSGSMATNSSVVLRGILQTHQV